MGQDQSAQSIGAEFLQSIRKPSPPNPRNQAKISFQKNNIAFSSTGDFGGRERGGLLGAKRLAPSGAALRALTRRNTWDAWPRYSTDNLGRVIEPYGRYPSPPWLEPSHGEPTKYLRP